jgi:hypothetical protein
MFVCVFYFYYLPADRMKLIKSLYKILSCDNPKIE